jgi:tetratricopeptide (TPR) repeat protein
MNHEQYQQLTKQAEEAFVHGKLERACQLLEQAENEAVLAGEHELADLAFCRRCYFLEGLDQIGEQKIITRLSEILLRSSELGTRCLAAYYAGMAYHIRGEIDKAERYVNSSIAMAEELDEPLKIAAATHLLGNLTVSCSRFGEAEAAYQRTLDLYSGLGSFHEFMEAQVRDNLGYIKICNGLYEEGTELCETARAVFERLESSHALPQVLQDLCYGYILCDRLDDAQECGERGLALALDNDDKLVAKNLYFLLAEVSIRNGDRFRARRYLGELAGYYPEIPESEEIVDVLLGTDFTEVVNLRG